MKKSQDKDSLRTWIEIDANALKRNISTFRKLIGPKVQLMAVVKSNAYGHGLVDFARKVSRAQGAGRSEVDWLGVDTFPEAVRLRKEGIRRPILVLGYTLPALFPEAAKRRISLTISTFENIKALKKLKHQPNIHIKIDTGMHRQGFAVNQVPQLIKLIKQIGLRLEGVYTHFASAKDRTYPFYTKRQIAEFAEVLNLLSRAGFTGFLRHAAATAGTLLHPEAYYDMVRLGIGLYGLWPSREIMLQQDLPMEGLAMSSKTSQVPKIELHAVLSWKTIISEVKKIPAGSYVGYDLTEQVHRPTKMAVLPVGYWHGVDRGLSGIGHVLIRGRRCKILGRVSMDMITIDVTGVPSAKVGDAAILIGKQGRDEITAYEWAEKLGTTHYEIITRINPLIKRIY